MVPIKHAHYLVIVPLVVLSTGAATAMAMTSTAVSASPKTGEDLSKIQARGDSDITSRLTSLGNLVSKLSTAKKLTTAQKASLTSELTSQTSQLTSLKATLDNETTAAGARTDFQKIFSEHYIYAFYLPRVNRIMAADAESDAATKLTALVPKLQTYITKSGNTTLQVQLGDLQLKAADAQTKSDAALTSLMPLTASGYPGNKSVVDASATELKAGRSDLSAAAKDASAIISALRSSLKDVQ